VSLFYTEELGFRGQDIGDIISPDGPDIFKYFMEEFKDRDRYITV
jgi:hypothetical protein